MKHRYSHALNLHPKVNSVLNCWKGKRGFKVVTDWLDQEPSITLIKASRDVILVLVKDGPILCVINYAYLGVS